MECAETPWYSWRHNVVIRAVVWASSWGIASSTSILFFGSSKQNILMCYERMLFRHSMIMLCGNGIFCATEDTIQERSCLCTEFDLMVPLYMVQNRCVWFLMRWNGPAEMGNGKCSNCPRVQWNAARRHLSNWFLRHRETLTVQFVL